MMKLGMICNNPGDENLGYVKSLGLEFIEACTNDDNETGRFLECADENLTRMAKYGLTYGSIGRWNSNLNAGGKVNETQYALIEQLLDKAIECKSPTFVCGCNYDDGVSLYRNYTAAIEAFGRLADRARGTGTRIAVYNCDWNNFVNNANAWSVVLGELPDVFIKFDASHSFNAGRDYLREVGDWGDRFAHVHIKGTVRTGGRGIADPPAGIDDLKWPAIFAALYSCGYDGCLSIEPHSSAWQMETERGKAGVRFTVDFIRRFIL